MARHGPSLLGHSVSRGARRSGGREVGGEWASGRARRKRGKDFLKKYHRRRREQKEQVLGWEDGRTTSRSPGSAAAALPLCCSATLLLCYSATCYSATCFALLYSYSVLLRGRWLCHLSEKSRWLLLLRGQNTRSAKRKPVHDDDDEDDDGHDGHAYNCCMLYHRIASHSHQQLSLPRVFAAPPGPDRPRALGGLGERLSAYLTWTDAG